jgi:hypothetical protein
LSDPDDHYLEINLDEENQFVRTEHLVSAIFDYLNVADPEVADEIYRRLEIDKLDDCLTRDRADLEQWLRTAFPNVDDRYVGTVLDEVEKYIARTKAPITPPELTDETDQFWEAARIPSGTTQSDLESRLDGLKFKRELFQRIADGTLNVGYDE